MAAPAEAKQVCTNIEDIRISIVNFTSTVNDTSITNYGNYIITKLNKYEAAAKAAEAAEAEAAAPAPETPAAALDELHAEDVEESLNPIKSYKPPALIKKINGGAACEDFKNYLLVMNIANNAEFLKFLNKNANAKAESTALKDAVNEIVNKVVVSKELIETEEALNVAKNDFVSIITENNTYQDMVKAIINNCPVGGMEEPEQEGGARSEDEFSMMGGDPLFLVLSEFFVSKSGKNIADILEEINENLQGKKGKWPFGKK
jgi:hypothetical protein